MHQFINLKSASEDRELKVIEKENQKIIFKSKGLCECGEKAEYTCPDCQQLTCGDHSHGYRKCMTVMGRRGWRKLGEYDS